MDGTAANLEQQLAELNQQYLRRLQQELPQLQWLLLQFVQAGPLEWREQAAVLLLRFHTLAGSAGTFGLANVGTIAKSIEQQLKALLTQQQVPSRDEHALLQQQFVEMLHAAGHVLFWDY